jgi:hypothetical protein
MMVRERIPGSQSVLRLRVSLSERLFSLAPAWAALAGALATGGMHWRRDDILLLLGSILLVDGLWGQLWTQLAGQTATDSPDPVAGRRLVAPLPYATSESALSGLWRWVVGGRRDEQGDQPGATWRALLVACLLTFGFAAFLGPVALVLSGVALLLAVFTGFLAKPGFVSGLCQALFEIGLPWLLAHVLFGGLRQPGWPLLIAVSYLLLHGASLSLRSGRRLWLINLTQLVPLACLIAVDQPVPAGVLAITLLAPLSWQSWLARADGGSMDPQGYRQLAQTWWWAGLLVASWGIGR